MIGILKEKEKKTQACEERARKWPSANQKEGFHHTWLTPDPGSWTSQSLELRANVCYLGRAYSNTIAVQTDKKDKQIQKA